MTIEEYRAKYQGVSSAQVRGLAADATFRDDTEQLYKRYIGAGLNTHCPDCWFDAFVVLMKSDLTTMKERANRLFELRAGAVLIYAGDESKTCNRHSLTDELALFHLSHKPAYITLFAKAPANWQELVAGYVNRVAREQLPAGAETKNESKGVQTTTPKKKRAQSAKKA